MVTWVSVKYVFKLTSLLTLFLASNICSSSPRLLTDGWLKPWTAVSFIATLTPFAISSDYHFQLSNKYLPRPWFGTPTLISSCLTDISISLSNKYLRVKTKFLIFPSSMTNSQAFLVSVTGHAILAQAKIPGVHLDFSSTSQTQTVSKFCGSAFNRYIIKKLPGPPSVEILIKYKPVCGILLDQPHPHPVFSFGSIPVLSSTFCWPCSSHSFLSLCWPEGFAVTVFSSLIALPRFWQALLPNPQLFTQMSLLSDAFTVTLNNVSSSHHSQGVFSALFFSKASHLWYTIYFALSLSCYCVFSLLF